MQETTMKAAVFYGKGDLRYIPEYPMPAVHDKRSAQSASKPAAYAALTPISFQGHRALRNASRL